MDDPFINQPDETRQADPKGDKALALALAKLAWETKAESVRVLHVAKQSSICRCASACRLHAISVPLFPHAVERYISYAVLTSALHLLHTSAFQLHLQNNSA